MKDRTKSLVIVSENGIAGSPHQVRNRVAEFAVEMERRLTENDHKPGWMGESPSYLINKAEEHLQEAWKHRSDPEKYIKHLIDAANYTMMAADNAGGLK